jgi:hypothetical protein
MRDAMYGWMKKHLAEEGTGDPLPEPELKTVDPESLRCFPGDSRPDNFMTIPRFAFREARRLLEIRKPVTNAEEWQQQSQTMRRTLREKTLGRSPAESKLDLTIKPASDNASRTIQFSPEPGLTLVANQRPAAGVRVALLLDLAEGERAGGQPLAAELMRAGWSVVTLDLRATGRLAQPGDKIGRAPDHNTGEWAMWIGRPLLGQWVVDVRKTLDAISAAPAKPPEEIAVIGNGPAGVVAICAAAVDERIQRVAAVNMLASFVTDVPYEGQRLGILAPGILRDVGDIPHLLSLVAPRRVVLAGGVSGGGKALAADELQVAHQPAADVWKILRSPTELRFADPQDNAGIVAALK